MTSITHPKARSLLQTAADHALTSLDTANLNKHLAECKDCRQYAENLTKLQDDLRRITHERWARQNVKISAKEIKNRSIRYNFQIVGKFATATVILAFMFVMATNFSAKMDNIPAIFGSSSITPEWPILTPTPLMQKTATISAVAKCNDISYLVQEDDTLASIAARHSVSPELIRQRNGLSADVLTTNMVLVIPLCEHIPVDSTMTPTLTSTVTP